MTEKCNCKFCTLYALRKKALKSNDIEFIKTVIEKFSDLWINTDHDRNYYKSIIDGSWPQADKILIHSLEKTSIETVDIFSCFIDDVENDIARISSTNTEDQTYYMDIPRKDLEQNNIECSPGAFFVLKLKKIGDWEKLEFISVPRKTRTKEEIDELLKYHKEKYGDI